MISQTLVQDAISLGEEYLVSGTDSEIALYSIGSIDRAKKLSVKLQYLSLYVYSLSVVDKFYAASVSNPDIDYADYGVNDEDVEDYISYINEIIYTLFNV